MFLKPLRVCVCVQCLLSVVALMRDEGHQEFALTGKSVSLLT